MNNWKGQSGAPHLDWDLWPVDGRTEIAAGQRKKAFNISAAHAVTGSTSPSVDSHAVRGSPCMPLVTLDNEQGVNVEVLLMKEFKVSCTPIPASERSTEADRGKKYWGWSYDTLTAHLRNKRTFSWMFSYSVSYWILHSQICIFTRRTILIVIKPFQEGQRTSLAKIKWWTGRKAGISFLPFIRKITQKENRDRIVWDQYKRAPSAVILMQGSKKTSVDNISSKHF